MLTLNKTKNFKSLDNLDKERMIAVRSLIPPPNIGINKTNIIVHICKKFSFKAGFNNKEKHFYTFSLNNRECKFYHKKFKRVTNKFEIIKSIWE